LVLGMIAKIINSCKAFIFENYVFHLAVIIGPSSFAGYLDYKCNSDLKFFPVVFGIVSAIFGYFYFRNRVYIEDVRIQKDLVRTRSILILEYLNDYVDSVIQFMESKLSKESEHETIEKIRNLGEDFVLALEGAPKNGFSKEEKRIFIKLRSYIEKKILDYPDSNRTSFTKRKRKDKINEMRSVVCKQAGIAKKICFAK